MKIDIGIEAFDLQIKEDGIHFGLWCLFDFGGDVKRVDISVEQLCKLIACLEVMGDGQNVRTIFKAKINDEAVSAKAYRDETSSILENEDAFLTFCEQESHTVIGRPSRLPPMVRASVYNNDVSSQMDVWTKRFGADPRRPVLMRGSRKKMAQYRYHASDICERYLRIVRFCAFTNEEADEMRQRLREQMERRQFYFRKGYELVEDCIGYKSHRCYVNGKFFSEGAIDDLEWKRLTSIHRMNKRIEVGDLPKIRSLLDDDRPLTIWKPKLSRAQKAEAALIALKELGLK